MENNSQKRNSIIIVIIIIILLVLPPLQAIRMNLLESIFFPIKFVSYQITHATESAFYIVVQSQKISSDNKELTIQNQQLQLQNQLLQQTVDSQKSIAAVYESQKLYGISTVVAKVNFVAEGDIYSQFYINQGSNQGIAVGMPVVVGRQLIGRIAQVDGNSSLVYPITREGYHVSVMDSNENNLGITNGSNDVLISMMFTYAQSQLKVGDTLVTSSVSGTYPKGLLVGKVQSVKYSNGGELVDNLEINTGINPLKMTYVLVLKGNS